MSAGGGYYRGAETRLKRAISLRSSAAGTSIGGLEAILQRIMEGRVSPPV